MRSLDHVRLKPFYLVPFSDNEDNNIAESSIDAETCLAICQIEREPDGHSPERPQNRPLNFRDENNASETISVQQSAASSVKSSCQLDLHINLASDTSDASLQCYTLLMSPNEVFKPRKSACFLQKKISDLCPSSHNGDERKSRPFNGYKMFSPKHHNGLFHPHKRTQSCKLLKKRDRYDDESSDFDFESNIEKNLEMATVNSKRNICPQESKSSRNGEEVILQFPESLEPLISKQKAKMMKRSLTSPDLHQTSEPSIGVNDWNKCGNSFKAKSWKCQSFKAAFGKKFSLPRKHLNSPLSERIVSLDTLPIDCNRKAKSDNEILLRENPDHIQVQNLSESRINVTSQQPSTAGRLTGENRLRPLAQSGHSETSSRELLTSSDSNQTQPDENHQSKILFIIVVVFLICSLPRAILNLVEFEHMFSLYYLAYFVAENDEVVLKARAIEANEEIACFYPPFWFVLFTNVSSLFMTLNASLGFFIYSFSCALFRAELYLRVQRLKNELRAKQVKLFNALHCRTEGIHV